MSTHLPAVGETWLAKDRIDLTVEVTEIRQNAILYRDSIDVADGCDTIRGEPLWKFLQLYWKPE